MGEHLVLLVQGLKVEPTRIGLQQATASASNKITDMAYLRMDMGSNLAVCRICHDEDEAWNMETPCSCRGSLKFAHRKCVQMWCDAKGDIVCEICRQQFKPGYKAPPPRFYYNGVGTNFSGRGSLEIPENMRLSGDDFSDEFAVPSSATTRSFICCQIVAIIFTGLIVLRHALPILVDGTGDYLFTMKTIGILMPMCVVFKAFITIKRLRRQHDTSFNQDNESARWVHVL